MSLEAKALKEKSPFYGPNIKNHCESNAHYYILWVEISKYNKRQKNIRRLYDFQDMKKMNQIMLLFMSSETHNEIYWEVEVEVEVIELLESDERCLAWVMLRGKIEKKRVNVPLQRKKGLKIKRFF